MEAIIKLLEETGERFANRQMVLQLCAKDVDEYDRGKVAGKIEMLSYLMNELVNKDTNETATISED